MLTKKNAESGATHTHLTLGGARKWQGMGSTTQPISQSNSSDRTQSLGRVSEVESSQGLILNHGCSLLSLAVKQLPLVYITVIRGGVPKRRIND